MRRPEHALAERAEGKRRAWIVVGVLFVLALGLIAWNRTDGTIVCDLEELRNGQWESFRRTTDHATPEQIARLEAAFAGAGFMGLRTNYSRADCSDLSDWEIYRFDGATWRLVRLNGGDTTVPEGLHHLVSEFHEVLTLDRWVPESGSALSRETETR